MHALTLVCTRSDFRYDLQRGLRPVRSLKLAMGHEVLMYGGAQRTGLGFDRLVEEAKMRMGRYGVTPNMLIVSAYWVLTEPQGVSSPSRHP